MAYRSDIDALEARLTALDADLADRTRERDEMAAMLAEARLRQQRLADLVTGGTVVRRRRWIAFAAVAACWALVAVWGLAHRRHHASSFDSVVEQVGRYADAMCQCTDRSCAEHVADQLTAWSQSLGKEYPAAKPSESDVKRIEGIANRLATCMTRAMGPQLAE